MAIRGIGYFDSKGHYFKTPDEATLSDLAGLLGRMGDGDSLAPGIAKILFDKRDEIEEVFRDHDEMMQSNREEAAKSASNVSHLPPAKAA